MTVDLEKRSLLARNQKYRNLLVSKNSEIRYLKRHLEHIKERISKVLESTNTLGIPPTSYFYRNETKGKQKYSSASRTERWRKK